MTDASQCGFMVHHQLSSYVISVFQLNLSKCLFCAAACRLGEIMARAAQL